MQINEHFKYRNPENGLFVQGKVVEVKEHSYVCSILGDFGLHEFDKNFIDDLEKVEEVKGYYENRFEEVV
ncbi:MAG: hypothetical protein M0R77_19205 [Gammaproteobacteria bacterium]|nr:hypothetical protein [Gammaproteobacteria bacterium]